ncbi:sterol desaturase family protein [Waterburya agarophytonicola K14]|uniref:Sterol desaturase family protein n=1 Tax=Waterburya agarophytonicola KI4 TaxID=2874699 RepID=A0A964FFM2_9CYAN|nr:sterol desaturase family protein [Waterburya agarophytonicola]MCC0177147.1 sterol desaturase family protein [Waterburya agarophytonicola KI4]
MNLWLYYLFTFFTIILLRYFLLAGGTYWLFYFDANKPFVAQSSSIKSSRRNLIKKDITLSIAATVATAICAALVMTIYDSGATRLYNSMEDYGIGYLIISFLGVILLQDTCYYFFHRGFHHPLFYNWLHRGHHRSKDPTPWTSFALDFPEALIQGLFLVTIVFIIPLHFAVLALWLLTMTIWSLVTHLGFELFPNFPHHWLGKWFISSDHHSLHHHRYTKHYGLYFTVWDRLLGTN